MNHKGHKGHEAAFGRILICGNLRNLRIKNCLDAGNPSFIRVPSAGTLFPIWRYFSPLRSLFTLFWFLFTPFSLLCRPFFASLLQPEARSQAFFSRVFS